MKKQLLITALTTALSAATFAQETPAFNHAEALHNLIQHGEDGKCPVLAKKLPQFKAILDEGKKRLDETGTFNWTPKEMAKIEKYSKKPTPTIEDLTGQTETPKTDLSEETPGTQEKDPENTVKQ